MSNKLTLHHILTGLLDEQSGGKEFTSLDLIYITETKPIHTKNKLIIMI